MWCLELRPQQRRPPHQTPSRLLTETIPLLAWPLHHRRPEATATTSVTLEQGASLASAMTVGDVVKHVSGPAFQGAVVALTQVEAAKLSKSPGVAAVERDSVVSAAGDGK